ncbi:MAG TPA: HAD family hydrolase [Ignavibacteriaceae bacterium]|nr:HAD family hydrolase [Ignavibacteriaceae bacterium]
MNKYKGIIFDIDGTLTSTNELIFASFNHIAKKYLNRTFSDKELISFFGPTEDVILKKWCGDNYEKARKDYYDFYTENHHLADLYPGIKDILKDLKSKKIFLSVFTGKGKNAATITLKKLEIYNFFDMIITGDDVKEHKPSPEGIHIFLEKFKLKKEEVLMIGDAISDIKASRKAGIKIASVVWDSYAKEEIKKLGSDYVFSTVEELKEHLLG